MPNGGNITYGVKFDVDKQQLSQLKSELANLQKLTTQDIMKQNPNLGLEEAKQQLKLIKQEAGQVQTAISSAFNPKLGSLNISKLQTELKNLNIGQIYKDFQKAGAAGIQAFNQIPSAVMKTNLQLRESHSLLDRIGSTMTNSIKWGITSRVVNSLANSLQGAWNYTKALDTSLNDIRIVTGKSAEEMEKFAIQANKAAQGLGASTRDYTNAALIYYQQGLDDAESQRRAEITVKTANVTGQTGREASEQLTAIWNGYKVNAEEAELYIDKVAAVAAGTAADLEEMATGMSKVASAANAAGVDIDQLNATLATVISVTREAPETIGSSFKTIYARLGDLKLGGTDEDGVTLGKVSGQLEALGVQILKDNGDMREMGDIVEDIAAKWQTWTRAQQQAAAVAMAGKMQYSRLIALFDNWDMYNKAMQMSVNAMGTLQEQQDIYMESTKAHLAELSTAWERVFDSFVDNKGINSGIDVLTGLTNGLANFIEALGGGGNTLLTFGSIFTNVFSKQIAESIDATIKNSQAAKYNLQQLEGVLKTLNAQQESFAQGNNGQKNQAIETRIAGVQKIKDRAGAGLLNTEQIEQGMAIVNAHATAQNSLDAFDKQTEQLTNRIQAFVATQGGLMTAEEAEKALISSNTAEYEKYVQAIDKNDATLQQYKEDINQLKVAQEEYKKALEGVEQAEQQYGKRSNEATRARQSRDAKGKNLAQATKNVTKDLSTLGNRSDLSGSTLEGLQETNATVIANIKTTTKEGLKDIANDIQGLADAAESAMQDVEADFTKLGQDIEQHGSDITNGVRDQLVGDEQSTGEEETKFFENVDMTSRIQNIVQMTAAVGQLASGIQTLINLGSIWSNEDLTVGEKILQTIMALGTAIPLIITGFTTMKTSLVGLAVSFGVVGSAEEAATMGAAQFGAAIWTALAPILPIILAVVAAVALLVVGINAAIKAWNADADAAREAAQAAKEAEESYLKLKEAAEELKKTVSDYNDAKEELKDLKKGTEEYNKALEEANKTAKELMEKYNLYDKAEYKGGLLTFKEGTLENLQGQLDTDVQNASTRMYSAKIQANNAALKSQTTDTVRSTEVGFNPFGLIDDIFAGLNPLVLLNDTISITDNQVRDITSKLQQLEKEDEIQYEKIKNSNQAFEEWIQATYKGDYSMQQLAEQIGENRNAFIDLANATNEAAEANRRYISEMNKIYIEQQYGAQIGRMATNAKTGVIDQGLYNQIVDILNSSAVQKKIREEELAAEQRRNSSTVNLAGDKLTSQEAWSHEFSQGVGKVVLPWMWGSNKASGNLNTLVTQYLKSNGVSDKYLEQRIGRTNLDSNKDLAEAYAKLTGKDISGLTWKGDKFLDDSGETILDASNSDARAKMRAQIYTDIARDYGNLQIQQNAQAESQNFLDIFDNARVDAAKAGQKYGTDFSQALTDAISSSTNEWDLSNIYNRLDPNEVDELKNMNQDQLLELFNLDESKIEELGLNSGEEFAEKFQEALKNYKWDINDAIAGSMDLKKEEIEEYGSDLTKKKYAEYEKDIEIYAKNLMQVAEAEADVADGLKYDSDTAVDFAFRVVRMNKGIDKLADGMEDWIDILNKSAVTSQEYAETMYNIKDALADVYDTEMDYISHSFIKEHLDEIQKIATGDEQAIEDLRDALSEDILGNILIENNKSNQDEILNTFKSLREQIQEQMSGIAIGEMVPPGIDDTNFVKSLNQLIDDASLTVEQANAIFSAMGVEPTYATETVSQEQRNPVIETTTTTRENPASEFKYTGPDGTEHTLEAPNFTQIQTSKTIGYTKDNVEVPITAISMNGKQPHISGIKKAPTGSFNNYSSKNSGGKSPGSGKKGGGGSSKPSKEKPLDKKTDPYHDINIQLALTNSKLKLVQSQNDKAFGAKKIENYNNQLQLLNQKLDQTKQKMAIARKEQERLGGLLANRGARFNADGTLANYEELYKSELAKVNAMIDNYNNMSKEEQEAYKDTLDAAKEDFSKFEEELKDYDNTVSSLIPQLQQDIQDAIDEQIEIAIKKFNMEFEIHLDMTEARKDWNEFKKKILDEIKDDDIFGNARARAIDDMSVYLDFNGNGQLAAGIKQTQELIKQYEQMRDTGWSSVYGDNKTKLLEDLQTAYKDIEQSMLEMQQIQDDVYQAWLDTMDEINDKMAKQVEMYEQVSNIIEHDRKVIELVYGETDFDALARMYEMQHQNNLGLLDFQRQNAEFWEREMNSIVDKNSEEWKKARDNWVAAVNDLNATIEDSIQNIRDKMENAIDGIFDKFNKEITNGKGLDYLDQQWDLVNDRADDYLDTVNAAFGIRDLERKYQNAIDSTDNVSSQRKLNDLMNKELDALRSKDKLTEYDIERAQKRYEIELKRMELEEAQNTKTRMRLRRDSQGNYRYEYVADEDNIQKLKDELDALENSLYNFDKERFISLQNEIVGYVRDREEAIKEIQMDASLTEEERQARIAEINQLYNDLIQDITDQTVTAQTNLYQSGADELKKINDEEGQDFQRMVEEMVDQFSTGVHDMINEFTGPDGFKNQTLESMDALSQATRDYEDDLRDVQQASGEVFDDVEAGIDKNIPKTQDLIEENRELNDQYQDQIDKIKELNAELDQNLAKYKGITDAAKQAATAAYDYWMTENEIAAKKAAQEKQNSQAPQINSGSQGGNANANGTTKGHNGSSGRTLNEDTMSGIAGAIWIYGSSASGWGTGNTRQARLSEKFGSDYAQQVQDYINSHQDARNWSDWQRLKNYYYSTFRSGGYTGDWGDDDGRLAVLHKKELVLNSQDTQNMLDMMKIAREVIAAAGPNALRLNSGRYQSDAATNGQLEQNVHIEANFPNVESASEIEEAINNLVNLAAQRANYKNR